MKKLFFTISILLFSISLSIARPISKSYLQRTPAAFIPNKGQIVDQHGKVNNEVQYLFSSGLLNVELKSSGFSFDLFEKKPVPQSFPESGSPMSFDDKEEAAAHQQYLISTARIDVSLLGANPNARLVASDPDDAYLNFYNGPIGLNGLTNVPTYHTVTYQNVYPGIDMVFSAGEQQLEYSFILHPGANPKKIRLQFTGCDQLAINHLNDLDMNNQKGWITQKAPSAYTEITEQPVACSWKLKNNILQFNLTSSSNSSHENIVIDPNIIWGTYYGGGEEGSNGEVSLDKKNNIIVTGYTTATTGIATSGAYQTQYAGNNDVFLAKFTQAGELSWGTYYGGAGEEIAWSVATDKSNNIFIVGSTQSTSGIATADAHQTALDGTQDVYIAKFSKSGQILWSTYYGGSKSEQARSVTCDNQGYVYIVGYTQSADGMTTSGTYQSVYGGNGDAFLSKWSSDGDLVWGTYFSGPGDDRAHAVWVDNKGNVFLAGTVESSTGIATPGAFQTTFGGVEDACAAKFDASNGQLYWATYFGGNNEDHSRGIVTDKKGNVYIIGFTLSCNNIAHGNSFQSHYGGDCAADTAYDCYLAKFSPSGSACRWSTYWGGSQNDFFYGIGLDSKGDVFANGNTLSSDLITTPNAFQTVWGGNHDGNLLETDSLGNLIYATYMGTATDESFYDLAIDASNILYMFANTIGPEFVTPGVYSIVPNGKDYVLYKFSGNVGCYDAHEPNETMAAANKITYTTDTTVYGYTAAISNKNDQDWFSVKSSATYPYIKVWLKDNESQKYSVNLYNKNGNLLKQGLPDANGNVSIIYNGSTKSTTYNINIVHSNSQWDSVNCYRLLVGASSAPFGPISDRLQAEVSDHDLKIEPNPANDLFRLRFDADQSAPAVIRIYNIEQQVVFQTSLTTVPGNNEFMVKLPILAAGEYLVQWQQDNDLRSEKLIIAPSK